MLAKMVSLERKMTKLLCHAQKRHQLRKKHQLKRRHQLRKNLRLRDHQINPEAASSLLLFLPFLDAR